MFDSVRTRLTLWYAGVLALSLVAFAFLIYYAAARISYERQDESLRSTAQTVKSVYMEELEEEKSISRANEVLIEMIFPDRYVEVTDGAGNAVAWSSNLAGNQISLPAEILSDARQHGRGYTIVNGLRVVVVPLSSSKEIGFAAVAEPLSVIDEGLAKLRRNLVAGVPLVLLLASAGGYFLARKSLSPIQSMTRQTQRITAERLSSRLDVNNPRDELGNLATTINELLARLELSFSEQQRFIADASHELRTPLAVLRGETEVALEQTRSIDEYKSALVLIKDEAERLSRIVEDLFFLARQPIDAPAQLMKEPLSLNELVSECVRAAQVLALRKDLRLKSKGETKSLIVQGDDELLKRMLLNLLDNAVKYTAAGGEISVELTTQNGSAFITVRDTGIGISQSDQAHVFDRFYRVDKARSRALGGAGLGLSIVRWVVELHRGKITVDSTPGEGSVFAVEVPLSENSATAEHA